MEGETYDTDPSPAPYVPDLYDIEVSSPNGNYDDFDEYREEVNSFLRQLFRIRDPTNRAYSPLMFVNREILVDELGETTVRIALNLSPRGGRLEDAVAEFCNYILDQGSGPVARSLSASENLGFSPLSDIFKQAWTTAVYTRCSNQGLRYLTTLQARFQRMNIKQPRWAMAMNFLLLSEGAVFASAMGSILRCTGSPPISPLGLEATTREITNDNLTTASNSAKVLVRRFFRDILSSTVQARNELFAREVQGYRSQTNFILERLERLERDGFRAGELSTFGNAVFSAVESAIIILAKNNEMAEVFLMLTMTSQCQEVTCAAGAAYCIGSVANASPPVAVVFAVAGLVSAGAAVFADKRRRKAADVAAKHKELVENIRSSWNISWKLYTLLYILNYREQAMANGEILDHPDPTLRTWWTSHVNNGVGRGFDILLVRAYLSEQRRHLENNRTRFEALMADRDLMLAR